MADDRDRNGFDARFSAAEMKAMRRAARDESGVLTDFWSKIKRLGRNLPFAEDIVAAAYCASDPATPARVRFMILGGLAYFVLPFDGIPDFLPLVGFTDDAAVIGAVIAAVRMHMRAEHKDRAREFLES